jgi:ABC-type transport system substrate-binding protein
VPLSTPIDPKQTREPVPSPGPYYIASAEPHRTVLLRNPNYHGSRPRLSARIVFSDNTPSEKAVALVDSGQLDYLPPDLSGGVLGPFGPVSRRYGAGSAAARAGAQRFFVHLRPALDTIVFNTRRPLFRSARLRQAVGYALDRPVLAKAYADEPADRLIPAVIPGYDRAGLYPLAGPDLRTARRLAGPGRRHAVLLAPCDSSVVPAARVVRSDLARIGIAVEIVTTDACDRKAVLASFRRADLIITTNVWRGPPDRDPAAFFDDVLTHGGYQGARLPPGPWYAPAFHDEVERARGLVGPARIAAYRRLDDELARQAPLLVYGAFLYDEYFSSRVGCKLFQAFYEVVDLGALCVKSA